jgi:hypothetical protein
MFSPCPIASFLANSRSILVLAASVVFCVVPDDSQADDRPGGNRQQDSVSTETLGDGFQNPPVDSRPFVRWWWNDNRVEPKQLLRELDLLKKAGIGGAEVNPIRSREQVVDLK